MIDVFRRISMAWRAAMSQPWVFDLRFSMRMLRRYPLFALAVVATLALGIGANTAIFSIAYGLLIRPLPYPQPEEIVQICATSQGHRSEWTVTADELEFLRVQPLPLRSIGAYSPANFNLALDGPLQHVSGMYISYDYLDVLGVAPVLGRGFSQDEDRGGGSRVALIGYRLWHELTGGDVDIIGRALQVDGEPYTVIGVLPADVERVSNFLGDGENQVWLPLALASQSIGTGQNIGLLGRLNPGLPSRQAQQQIESVRTAFQGRFPHDMASGTSVELISYRVWLGENIQWMLLVLFGAAGFTLVIACANVVGLLMSRAEGRRHEVAVRMALGAGSRQLLRQFLAESVVLTTLGIAGAFLLAGFSLKGLLALWPDRLSRLQDIHLDGWALAFSVVLGGLASVVFGFAPAYRLLRVEVQAALQESQGGGAATPMRLRRALVVIQIALSLVLLVGSALLVQAFRNVAMQDPGVRRQGMVSIPLYWAGGSADGATRVYAAAVNRVRAAGLADSAAIVAAGLPFERGATISVRSTASTDMANAAISMVTPAAVDVMGIPMLRGRHFTASDAADALPVALINQTLARQIFKGIDPLGRTIQVGAGEQPREVIGIIGDVRSQLDQPATGAVMIPLAQAQEPLVTVLSKWFPVQAVLRVKSWSPAQAIATTDALHAAAPTLAVGDPRTVAEIFSTSFATRRFLVALLGGFSLLATVLGMIGIYGVMEEQACARTREMAIRKTVGASDGSIVALILGSSVRMIGLGLAAGAVASFALTQLLRSYLFGISACDPLTLLGMASILFVAALAAALVPAVRATRLDPMRVLRHG